MGVGAAHPARLADGEEHRVLVRACVRLAAMREVPGRHAGTQGPLGDVVGALRAEADEREQVGNLAPQPLGKPPAVLFIGRSRY